MVPSQCELLLLCILKFERRRFTIFEWRMASLHKSRHFWTPEKKLQVASLTSESSHKILLREFIQKIQKNNVLVQKLKKSYPCLYYVTSNTNIGCFKQQFNLTTPLTNITNLSVSTIIKKIKLQ